MTNTTPTPATMRAARETARELTDYFDAMQKAGRREGRLHYVGQLIAAALAEAERGQMERDCAAVCELCSSGYMPVKQDSDGVMFWHYMGGVWAECDANEIRAAIEQLRDGEKG